MAKSVVQYLRGLDISGVHLGPDPSIVSGPIVRSRASRHQGQDALNSVSPDKLWPSTDVLSDMPRLQWLRLRNVGLTDAHLPRELSKLSQLESLSLARNGLTRLSGLKSWPSVLPALRTLTCRKNELTDKDAIPSDIFECPNLQAVDFSCNHLTSVPRGIEKATGLLVLNLSQNAITTISPEVFLQCCELMFLDLSDNQLENLPAQLRRCTSLQQLILSRNPLRHAQLRSLSALKNLEVLHLASTERRVENIHNELDRLERLVELDLSDNFLSKIPEPVLCLKNLRKLVLSHNELNDLSNLTGEWPKLEYLNLSYNNLTHLPSGLTRLTSLRKLYVNNNKLTFGGIPSGIGKLEDLEIFDASHNELETIPESLCRCGRLRKLILNSNNLLTLPDAIHYLRESLKVFEYDNNPNLKFPPKPPELQKGAGLAFYNLDFSLDAHLRMMCGKATKSSDSTPQAKDPASRMRRLRRRRGEGSTQDSKCVLEGMQRVAKEKDALLKQREQEAEEESKRIATKRWQDQLTKPQLDYTCIFDEDTGVIEGVEMWELDQFHPKRVEDEVLQGRLFNGDCYIVLETKLNQKMALDWTIYYWIGSKSSKDKQTCAAIHAVNLRNLLGAEGRTKREEQDEESHDFLALFGGHLIVLDGARGETGFFHVVDEVVEAKLYRLYGQEKRLNIVAMPLTPFSLDPKFVYLLDAHSQLYLWLGKESRTFIQTKGRLLAEKISVRERRNEAPIRIEAQGRESNTFWAILTGAWLPPPLPNPTIQSDTDMNNQSTPVQDTTPADHPPVPKVNPPDCQPRDFIPVDWKAPPPILYDVRLGKGYLELPQVEFEPGQLSKHLLDPKHVYILDSGGELHVYMGGKSSSFLRVAGPRLAQALSDLMPRARLGGAEIEVMNSISAGSVLGPDAWWSGFVHPTLRICTEGAESQIFKAQFCDWEEPLAVDFTRTAESVARRGVDMNQILEKDKMTTDMRALLGPREIPVPWDDAMQMMSEWNDELEEQLGPKFQFVMVNSKWVPIEPRWFGQFFNQDSYILMARYWDFDDESEELSEDQADQEVTDRIKTVVYFWQGREASDLNWLQFEFSVRKDMQELLSRNTKDDGTPCKVEFKRFRQQQEELPFLSHFHRKFVIHSGKYRDRQDQDRASRVQMYYVRANGNPIATRCIEIQPATTYMNSYFCYILKIPGSDNGTGRTQVYSWIGNKAPTDDRELTETLSRSIFDWMPDVDFITINEGSEPDIFWQVLGGKRKYDTTAEFLDYGRLFRLSNEQGYFSASEKCFDFCQDELADDHVMMLDTGAQIYLWWGKRASDVEKKLSLQAAKLYQSHMSRIQPNKPRQLKLTTKSVEPFPFRRCFHGWGPFKEVKDWSG